MSTTLSSTLSNLLPKFIARAKLRSAEKQVFTQFVDVLQHGAGQGRVYNEPIIGRLTAYAGSEGVPVGQAQALADSNTAWTPTEHLVQVVVTKRAIFVNREPILSRANEQMTDALSTRKDTQITTLYGSATGTNADQGSAGQALLTSLVFQAKATVINADDSTYGKIPAGPGGQLIFAVNPLSLFDIQEDVLAISTNALAATSPLGEYAAEVFKNGMLGNAAGALAGHIAGCLVVQSTAIAPDTADDADNIVYARDAFVLVESGGIEDNTDMTQISGRAVEITMSEWYVAAERTDGWANAITADAAAV